MQLKDQILYHQIHPAKLLTDGAAGIICLYSLWQHRLPLALLIAVIPPLVASALVIRFADFESLKRSAFGTYVGVHMTPAMQALRLFGFLVMAAGAWYHAPSAMLLGFGVVLAGWLKGTWRMKG